jgi:hypothetical protein
MRFGEPETAAERADRELRDYELAARRARSRQRAKKDRLDFQPKLTEKGPLVRRVERTRSMKVRQQFCWWERDDGLGRCGKPVKCRSPLTRIPSCWMHYQRERRRILASQGLSSDGRPYKRRRRSRNA